MDTEYIHKLFAKRGVAFVFAAAAMPVGLLSFHINEIQLLPGFVAWLMLLLPFLALRAAMEAAGYPMLARWGLWAILASAAASLAALFLPELNPLASFVSCFGLLALIRLCDILVAYTKRLKQYRLSRGWKFWYVLLWIFLIVRLVDAIVSVAFLISNSDPWNRTYQLGSGEALIAVLVLMIGIVLAIIVHGIVQCGGMITLIRMIERTPWLLPSSTASGPPVHRRDRDR